MKKYVLVPTHWLDDYNVAGLPDKEYRKFVTDYVTDPENIKYEDYRNSWNVVRKKMTRLVMKRDKHECRICGSKKNLQIDHIYPMARGGTNDLDNLQILCKKCNLKKSDKVDYGKE
jgi:5-methylcytosine-specific restriction protein A